MGTTVITKVLSIFCEGFFFVGAFQASAERELPGKAKAVWKAADFHSDQNRGFVFVLIASEEQPFA